MRPLKRFGCFGAAFGVLVIAVLFYSGFQEDVYCRRGSWNYWVGINKPISDFPMPGLIGEPEFHWGCGDGPKRPDESVSYHSQYSTADLLVAARNHAAAHGFTSKVEEDPSTLLFEKGRETLWVSVKAESPGITKVDATTGPVAW